MSEIFITLVSTLVMYLLYYLTVDILDKKVHLGLARKGNRIRSRAVYVVGIVMASGGIAVNLVQSPTLLSQRILNICLLWALAVLAVSDWKIHRIPNCILVTILIIWAAVTGISMFMDATNGRALFVSALVGGFLGGLLFFACYLLAPGRLGAGDVKLVFVLGLYLTEKKILGAIFAGMILCCIFTLMQLVRKKGQRKGGVPLAPFLFLGTLLVLLV